MKKNTFLLLFFVIILSLFLFSCNKQTDPITKSDFSLGTIVTLTVYQEFNENQFETVFDKVKWYESILSKNIDSSDISNINNNAGSDFVNINSETYALIEKGLYYQNITNNKFNIAIGPLVELWGIGTDSEKVPDESSIQKVLELFDYNNIILNNSTTSVMLAEKDMKLDLGGIAKGYIADMIKQELKDSGISSAIINLGGNILTIGQKEKGQPFKIGIQNPFESRNNYIGIIDIEDLSVVTSGTYERYFEQDGIIYHHILDPLTGYPVRNNLASVSIISQNSIDGDALSTSAFALGLDKGLELIENIENVEAIFVTNSKELYFTSGIKMSTNTAGIPFELVDTDFVIK